MFLFVLFCLLALASVSADPLSDSGRSLLCIDLAMVDKKKTKNEAMVHSAKAVVWTEEWKR